MGSSSESSGNWILGVVLNILGSVSINFGTNLIKYAYIHNPGERTRVWRLGMAIFVVGNIVNFVSFSFAAQSLLAALEPTFVTNVIFGYLLLDLPVTRKMILSTSLIIVGNILIVIYSSHDSNSYTTSDLMDLYSNTMYIVYVSLAAAVCVGGTFIYQHLMARLERGDKTVWVRSVIPALYAVCSGLIGTQSIIFAKSLSNVVILTFSGDNQFGNWFSYAILAMWLCTMVFWLNRMNHALIVFPGNAIIPVLQVVWIILGVTSGGIYYEEFDNLSSEQVIGFGTGLVLVLIGVVFLSPRVDSKKTPKASKTPNRRKSDQYFLDLEDPGEFSRYRHSSVTEYAVTPFLDRLTISEMFHLEREKSTPNKVEMHLPQFELQLPDIDLSVTK